MENASMEDIRQMENFVDRMTKAFDSGNTKTYSNLDGAFHFHIAESSHNPFMLHYFATCRSQMEQFIFEAFNVLPRLLDSSQKFHRKICEGIKTGNADLAKNSMADHLNDVRLTFEAFYKLADKTGRFGIKT